MLSISPKNFAKLTSKPENALFFSVCVYHTRSCKINLAMSTRVFIHSLSIHIFYLHPLSGGVDTECLIPEEGREIEALGFAFSHKCSPISIIVVLLCSCFLVLACFSLPPSLLPHSHSSFPCSLIGGNVREDGTVQKAAGSFSVSRLGTGLYEVVVGDGPKTER